MTARNLVTIVVVAFAIALMTGLFIRAINTPPAPNPSIDLQLPTL